MATGIALRQYVASVAVRGQSLKRLRVSCLANSGAVEGSRLVGNLDWQLWTTLAVVAGAAFATGRRILEFVTGRGTSPCGDCSAKPTVDDQSDRVISENEIGLLYEDNER